MCAGNSRAHMQCISSSTNTDYPVGTFGVSRSPNTFAADIVGRDIILFTDIQSVCCAMTKGCSKPRDIQTLSTVWHAMCMVLKCRVWIEWVPSDCNPADEISRYGTAFFEQDRAHIAEIILPEWADLRACSSVTAALDWIFAGEVREPWTV